jgi:hypothetical protein
MVHGVLQNVSNKKRILVCGGRHYGTYVTDDDLRVPHREQIEGLRSCLNSLLVEFSDILIIHGKAKGADSLAEQWAIANNIEQLGFPAQWNKYGKAAGPLRNVQMLEEGKPDLVIAFPGGTGTAMMCKIASAAGVEVRRVN